MKTIAIANHKGGPGKTTTTYWLARHLADAEQLPLCIDLDPQGNLTRMLGCAVGTTNGIADVLLRRTTLRAAMQPTIYGVDMIGTDIKLEDASAAIQGRSPNHRFLANAIRDSGLANLGNYTVLIDCAPAANILTINALVAADAVVIVLDPERDAIDGMHRIVAMVDWLRNEIDHAPAILGAVVTKVNQQTVLHRVNLESIEQEIAVLGRIPYRRGVDADDQIGAAYAPVAAAVWAKLMEVRDAQPVA